MRLGYKVKKTMDEIPSQISEKMITEVIELASRLNAQKQKGYPIEDLIKAGREAEIPAECIYEAIAQIQEKKNKSKEKVKYSYLLGFIGSWVGFFINFVVFHDGYFRKENYRYLLTFPTMGLIGGIVVEVIHKKYYVKRD